MARVCDATDSELVVVPAHCSADITEVWHGQPTPAYGCGAHVTYSLDAVYDGHRRRMQREHAEAEMAKKVTLIYNGHNNDIGDWCPYSGNTATGNKCPQYCQDSRLVRADEN